MTQGSDVQLMLSDLLAELHDLAGVDDGLPDPSTGVGQATRDFFRNNWEQASEGLLQRSDRVRVRPLTGAGPRSFAFEFDTPYKRKRPDGLVEIVPGPVRGTIRYRGDIFAPEIGAHSLMVFIDSERFFHPNFSPSHGVICIGAIPPGPFPLDALLEHLYSIVSYQNMDLLNPADHEAVRYFATDPAALEGLADPLPLY